MGVKGAKNKKEQEKWNKFISALVQHAGLPNTSLIRLTFTNSKGKRYEINNYDDLTQLSTEYATNNAMNHIQMNIVIEVLALTFTDYQKRFKYEQDIFMKNNNINLHGKNSTITNKDKQILSTFVLSSLITTKAVIQKPIKMKKPSVSQSPSINIMDFLNVEDKFAQKPEKEANPPVLNDIFDNIVDDPPSVSAPAQMKKSHKLSTIYNLPLVSFEELRFKHYLERSKWKDVKENQLVILNWPNTMNRDTLRTLFKAYGNITECEVNNDQNCSFVVYDNNKSAQNAIKTLDGFMIGNNRLSVQFLQIDVDSEVEKKEVEKEENEQQQEDDRRLVVGNWPNTMNEGLLRTLFSPYGELIETKIVNETAFIEYKQKTEAQKAYVALNGFQMGQDKLTLSFSTNEISHILNMELMQQNNDITEDISVEEIERIPDKTSIFEQMDENEAIKDDGIELHLKPHKNDEIVQATTPNESDIEEMVLKENEKEEKEQHKYKEEAAESSTSSSSLSDSDSDSSDSFEKLKKKKSLSKKQLKKLKKKRRKRRKKRKERKKIEKRQKYVDSNISALNECLDKFTNLMSSVSQSAMIMQQSVAQISQIHAQQQQQSMVYQQSMQTLFPNQPMYTSIIPDADAAAKLQQQQQPGTPQMNNNPQSESIQNIINQISTQGGPDHSSKQEKGNAMNTDILNQQLIQQHAMRIAQQNSNNNVVNNAENINNKAWIESNFGKPNIVNKGSNIAGDITSSPILHSTHHNNDNNNNDLNTMNLSADSWGNNNNNGSQPGNNPSKSKIFEHKKALRNVSKEMDQKLTVLNNMGYKNRTFNLVLLKQENGDMDKVISALKQFYQSN